MEFLRRYSKAHSVFVLLIVGLLFVGAGCQKPSQEVMVPQDKVDTTTTADGTPTSDEGMVEEVPVLDASAKANMQGAPAMDAKVISVTTNQKSAIMQSPYQYEGDLMDVSGGSAAGEVMAGIVGETYQMVAYFTNLPKPNENEFYEGWLVRTSPFSFLSTGKVEAINGRDTNFYMSSTNLTDYDFYVLTVESNDGDPAPAKHILEGQMMKAGADEVGESGDGAAMQQDGEGSVGADTVMENGTVVEVALTGKNFAFSQNEIKVRKGDRVKITFTSTQGFHDWVVDEFNARTERVNDGGSTSVEFVANKAGTFEYYCSVGSHRQMGMVGDLIVE